MITFIVGPQGSGKNKRAEELIDGENFEKVSGLEQYKARLLERSRTYEKVPENMIIDEFDFKDFGELLGIYNSTNLARMQELYVLIQFELQEPIIFMRA